MPGLSNFPTTIDSYTVDEDGVTTYHADDVNEARDFAIAAETKMGADDDALSAATLEGRAKYQEAGGLKRGSSVASATSITLTDAAQVFPITGTVTIATIAAPSYPRLVYLEFASALTLTHGSGNLTLPGASDLAVPAGAVVALEWTGSTWRVAGAAGSTPPIDPAANVGGSRTLGTGALQAAAGNDSRLADARTPTAHHDSHVIVGQDPLPTFTATTRGLVPPPGGSPSGVKALYDNGTWADPAVASGGMSNPMTAQDSLILGGTAGDPVELAKGTDGQVVGVDPSDHHVKYVDPPPSAVFDVGQDGSVPGPGAINTSQFLRTDGAWATPSGSGFSNPMTTQDDLIIGGSSGTAARLAKGTDGQVLTVDPSTHHLVWATPSGGGGGGSSGALLWDPFGLALPVAVADLSVHDNWAGSGIVTAITQEGDAVAFKNPCSGTTIERGAFGANSGGPYSVPTSGPFTATACFYLNSPIVQNGKAALTLRQSGNDKRIQAGLYLETSSSHELKVDGANWTNATTLSGSPFGTVPWSWGGGPIWLRIRDDNSNCFWEVSRDGQYYQAFASGGTRSFCTPDQAGITMESFGNGSGAVMSMILLSLRVINTA